MKRIFISALLALSLAACATIQNPVTQSSIDAVNNSWGVALSLANAYADSCRKRLIPSSCRTVVLKMQQAAPPVQTAVLRARAFAKNPTISSVDLVQAASNAVNDFKLLQMENGVR